MRAFFIADITNYARVPPYALNFVQIIKGQKLDASVVDGEPNLDLYQLTRFPQEPTNRTLVVMLDCTLQLIYK